MNPMEMPVSGQKQQERDALEPSTEVPEIAYLGLGSSVGDRWQHLRNALNALQHSNDEMTVEAVSPVYESPHLGLNLGDESRYPPHLNCVAKVVTTLAPSKVLAHIRSVETAGKRQRTERWGPRTIDIDLLLYGDRVIETPDLTVPHPGLTQRAFVILPLGDLNPDLRLPNGELIRELAELNSIRTQRIERVATHELLF